MSHPITGSEGIPTALVSAVLARARETGIVAMDPGKLRCATIVRSRCIDDSVFVLSTMHDG